MSTYTDADYEAQRTQDLLDAISDWQWSRGRPEHARDRRWAMKLIAAERKRRDLRRAQFRTAVLAAQGMLPTMWGNADVR